MSDSPIPLSEIKSPPPLASSKPSFASCLINKPVAVTPSVTSTTSKRLEESIPDPTSYLPAVPSLLDERFENAFAGAAAFGRSNFTSFLLAGVVDR
ncbi:hypothetical protein TrVE_jg3848 [Triparma verrucosa]|uniref:Uncharacterized protein n=1 Tax=Triparma verrucosa TaxID=1606542 RepID=A0A9W7F291_9STRA|nr:hypothetical protein TrVE_jg3848 [Triparma verrucosa]